MFMYYPFSDMSQPVRIVSGYNAALSDFPVRKPPEGDFLIPVVIKRTGITSFNKWGLGSPRQQAFGLGSPKEHWE